jgi:hypothetical protein
MVFVQLLHADVESQLGTVHSLGVAKIHRSEGSFAMVDLVRKQPRLANPEISLLEGYVVLGLSIEAGRLAPKNVLVHKTDEIIRVRTREL